MRIGPHCSTPWLQQARRESSPPTAIPIRWCACSMKKAPTPAYFTPNTMRTTDAPFRTVISAPRTLDGGERQARRADRLFQYDTGSGSRLGYLVAERRQALHRKKQTGDDARVARMDRSGNASPAVAGGRKLRASRRSGGNRDIAFRRAERTTRRPQPYGMDRKYAAADCQSGRNAASRRYCRCMAHAGVFAAL